jgi:hypothetical protein
VVRPLARVWMETAKVSASSTIPWTRAQHERLAQPDRHRAPRPGSSAPAWPALS